MSFTLLAAGGEFFSVLLSRLFLGLETKIETLHFRSPDQDRDLSLQVSRPRPRPGSSGLTTEIETWTKWTRVHSSLETMVSRSQHINSNWWQSTRLNKGATNYGNRPTGVGTKHAVLRPRPRPGSSGLETETWLEFILSRYRPGQNELESRDHGLEITRLVLLFHPTLGYGMVRVKTLHRSPVE